MSDLTHAASRQEPSLATLPALDEGTGADRVAARGGRRSLAPWATAAALAAVAAAAFLLWRNFGTAPPAPGMGAKVEPPTPPAQVAESPPAIRYPVEAAPAGVAGAAAAGPTVDPAAALLAALFALPGATGLDHLILTDDFVHRFVATVDNLPRASVASKVMLVRPAAGSFAIDVDDGHAFAGRGNSPRYAPYLHTLQAADTAALVALYVRNYPLFQQAYRDLGYPNGYFNDRLVDVIDHLLAAPEPAVPPALLQPRVLYEYANPDFEARSAGQKAMLRLGVENERAAKGKLREIRRALTTADQAR